jgi:hypothetical protein
VLRFHDTESRLILLWTVLGLVLSSILILDPPSHTRLIVLFPVPFILAVLTLETLFGRMARGGIPRLGLAVGIISALVVGQAAVFNLGGYWKYARWIGHESRVWDILQSMHRFGDEYDYYLFGGPTLMADSPPLLLFDEGLHIVTGVNRVDVPRCLARDTVFIVFPYLVATEPELFDIETGITEQFPAARREVVGREDDPKMLLYIASTDGLPPPADAGARKSR